MDTAEEPAAVPFEGLVAASTSSRLRSSSASDPSPRLALDIGETETARDTPHTRNRTEPADQKRENDSQNKRSTNRRKGLETSERLANAKATQSNRTASVHRSHSQRLESILRASPRTTAPRSLRRRVRSHANRQQRRRALPGRHHNHTTTVCWAPPALRRPKRSPKRIAVRQRYGTCTHPSTRARARAAAPRSPSLSARCARCCAALQASR